MKKFNGFPARMQFTAVPNLFFSSLLPQITDMAELKLTLHIFRMVYSKKGYPRFVSFDELVASKGVTGSLNAEGIEIKDELLRALGLAVDRGTILHLTIENDGAPQDIYFLNTEQDRRAVERIKNGELVPSGLKISGRETSVDAGEVPNVFSLYEQNIGMLTPMIAEELGEAEKLYPEGWIRDAVKEAVSLNKRNWRYIARILERWAAEGRDYGTHRGDTEKGTDKYSGQKYGHLFKR